MESEFSTKVPSSSVPAIESLKQAEAEYEMSLLAATLAHEIRNPLQTIKLQLDLAARGAPTDESLQKISDCVERLEAVVERVQKLSQRYSLNPEKVNLRNLLEDTLDIVNFWLTASGVVVRTHVQWEGEPICFGDRELIQQVLLNLFMNAIQAMPDGGTLSLYVSEEIDFAVVEVSDTGCGISNDSMKHVGTPFFTTKDNGHGLGIAFCRTIAALHGGSIEIESRQNEGTKVFFRVLKEQVTREGNQNVQ